MTQLNSTLRTISNTILNPELTIQQHIDIITEHGPTLYKGAIKSLLENNIPLSPASKARNIVALWATKNFSFVDELLPTLLPAEIFKVCQILDAPRKARQLQKKLDSF